MSSKGALIHCSAERGKCPKNKSGDRYRGLKKCKDCQNSTLNNGMQYSIEGKIFSFKEEPITVKLEGSGKMDLLPLIEKTQRAEVAESRLREAQGHIEGALTFIPNFPHSKSVDSEYAMVLDSREVKEWFNGIKKALGSDSCTDSDAEEVKKK